MIFYILIILAVALIAYILFFNKKVENRNQRDETQNQPEASVETEKFTFNPEPGDLKIGTIEGKSFAYLKEKMPSDKKSDPDTLVEEIYFENSLEEEHMQSAEDFIKDLKAEASLSEKDEIKVTVESLGEEAGIKEEEDLSLNDQEELLKQKKEIEDFYNNVDKNISDTNKLFEGIKNAYTGKKKM